MLKIISFSLVSPLQILKWGGQTSKIRSIVNREITIPLTYSLQSKLPERKGLFCDQIFKNLLQKVCCYNHYKITFDKNQFFCFNCNTLRSFHNIQYNYTGYIKLAFPVAHSWYLKTYLPIILESKATIIIKLFCCRYSLLNNLGESFKVILPLVHIKLSSYAISNLIILIYQYLYNMNLLNLLHYCRCRYTLIPNLIVKTLLLKKMRLLHLLFVSGIRPNWLLITVLPIMPPKSRPIIYSYKLGMISSPLNDLYRKILIRNNRLLQNAKTVFTMYVIVEQCLLQQVINQLFDNIFALFKVSQIIKKTFLNKDRYFKQYVLGKRVDFSGRSTIISGVALNIGEIGLPYNMLIELLNFYINRLYIIIINYLLFINKERVLFFLYSPINLHKWVCKLIHTKSIIINRAPTLHKFNIQAMKVRLIETEAIQFYPLLCSSFNADFDGDQVGIFLPLSLESMHEIKTKLYLENNLLSLLTSTLMLKLNHNMILGIFFNLFLKHIHLFIYRFYSDIDDIKYNVILLLLKKPFLVWIRVLYIYKTKIFLSGYIFSNIHKLCLSTNTIISSKFRSIFV